MSFADLAERTGLNVRTLHNVASGTSQSRRARNRIETALGVILWPQPGTTPADTAPAAASSPAIPAPVN
jgi:hypothetical protein